MLQHILNGVEISDIKFYIGCSLLNSNQRKRGWELLLVYEMRLEIEGQVQF